jgi:hypothetical protein
MTNRKNYNSILFLTVYLGLVLVGATPQVMAHAATNSLFDLRQEIEYKDDLDNKPDESCPESKAKIVRQDNQGIETDSFPLLREDFSINFFDLKANKDRLFSKIIFNTNFDTKRLTPFVLAFNQNQDSQLQKFQEFPEKVIYENTKVISQNKQIFIVTRLPRASIDSLLKQ